MSSFRAAVCLSVIFLAVPLKAVPGAKALQIYFIDVEGGQSTLVVTPSGQSLLIDAGWAGYEGRDADRIISAARQAGLSQIDYVLITHYHRDHVGGVPQLVEGFKVGTFVDHGPNLEDSAMARDDYAAYEKAIAGHAHVVIKPGWGLPIKGIEVHALTAAGDVITDALPAAGEANPYCAKESAGTDDKTENAQSVGLLITYGKFRFLDLGDLTKKKELELVCPDNLIGKADLFLLSHHGADNANSRALVWALHPRVGIIDNGARKGSSVAAWQIVHDSPGLEDLWQLHYSEELDRGHNVADDRIANVKENCEGKFLKIEAQENGSFSVVNGRTGAEISYTRK